MASLSSSEVLRLEVLKTDVERMRLLAIDEEYSNLFDFPYIEETQYTHSNKTIEEDFEQKYLYWNNIPDKEVVPIIIETWGEQYLGKTWVYDTNTNEQLMSKVDDKLSKKTKRKNYTNKKELLLFQ